MAAEITPDMSMTMIQRVLDKGGDIEFKKGTYKISNTLILFSNSFISCDDGVVFEKHCAPTMFLTNVGYKTTLYKGAHDIVWYGGNFISDVKSKTQSNIFTLFHAQNVTIRDITVQQDYAQHVIEINASKNIKVEGCTFMRHKPPKDYKEVIQLDFANYAGFTFAPAESPCYDGTHCQGIKIYRNRFEKCGHAIGTHTVSTEAKAHKNIMIIENEYHGLNEGIFVKLLNMQDVKVAGNDVTRADIMVKLNAMKTETFPHGGTRKVDLGKRNKNVTITENLVDSSTCEVVVI